MQRPNDAPTRHHLLQYRKDGIVKRRDVMLGQRLWDFGNEGTKHVITGAVTDREDRSRSHVPFFDLEIQSIPLAYHPSAAPFKSCVVLDYDSCHSHISLTPGYRPKNFIPFATTTDVVHSAAAPQFPLSRSSS